MLSIFYSSQSAPTPPTPNRLHFLFSDGALPAQLEIILTFFIGFYETSSYIDSLPVIAKRYLSSPTLFWFDVSTSIPLSYIDLYFAKVSALPSCMDFNHFPLCLIGFVCLCVGRLHCLGMYVLRVKEKRNTKSVA